MKLKMKKVVALFLATVSALCLFSCGKRGSNIRNEGQSEPESVDVTKTQLNVGFYYAGLGKDWIQEAKTLFEERYKDVSFETNKMGVQVVLNLDKSGLNGSNVLTTISAKEDHVFFVENSDLNAFVSDSLVADITDVVKSKASADETVTIEQKLDDNSKAYYDMGGKYYGLPYYEDFMSINYNIDLFKAKNYYFAKGKTAENFDFDNDDLSGLFIQNPTAEKSTGPDGKPNTSDDGLPATYADFRALLMWISANGDTPMMWCGSYLTYLIDFMNGVWADYEGPESFNLNYTMDGVASNLINVDKNGNVSYLDPVTIAGNTGYMLQKQEGKYRALEFAKMCVEDSSYYYQDSFSSGLTHIDAQRRFVKGGTGNYQNVAMLIDGNWWEVEATEQFDQDPNASNSKLKRNFGSMPVPKASPDKIGEKRTLYSVNKSMCFINANTSSTMMPVAKEFLKFCQSDEVISIFCRSTNMMRPLNYTLSDETLSQMSTYGKQMYAIHNDKNVSIVNDFCKSDATVKNTSLLNAKTWGWSNNKGQVNPFVIFKENADMTAGEYFNSMYDLYVGSWGAKWIS